MVKTDDGCCEGFSAPLKVSQEEGRGDVEAWGYKGGGEPGFSLLWLSLLSPDRPARACNRAKRRQSKIHRHEALEMHYVRVD